MILVWWLSSTVGHRQRRCRQMKDEGLSRSLCVYVCVCVWLWWQWVCVWVDGWVGFHPVGKGDLLLWFEDTISTIQDCLTCATFPKIIIFIFLYRVSIFACCVSKHPSYYKNIFFFRFSFNNQGLAWIKFSASKCRNISTIEQRGYQWDVNECDSYAHAIKNND